MCPRDSVSSSKDAGIQITQVSRRERLHLTQIAHAKWIKRIHQHSTLHLCIGEVFFFYAIGATTKKSRRKKKRENESSPSTFVRIRSFEWNASKSRRKWSQFTDARKFSGDKLLTLKDFFSLVCKQPDCCQEVWECEASSSGVIINAKETPPSLPLCFSEQRPPPRCFSNTKLRRSSKQYLFTVTRSHCSFRVTHSRLNSSSSLVSFYIRGTE